MPFALILALYPTNIGTSLGANSASEKRHFVVDEVAESGVQINTFKGESSELDPFIVSEELGAKPYPEDKFTITPDLSERFGSQITLYRAPVYTIKDGKKIMTIRSWQTTVGDLIIESKIPEIGVDDKINFALDQKLELSMQITIIRVAKTTVIEKEAINFKTVKKENSTIEKGNQKIVQAGKRGLKNNYFLVTREDGVEVSKNFTKSEVVEEPTNEIIEIGTKVVVYGSGIASIWKSSGEMIAACNFVSRGTKVHVVNQDNKKSVNVTCMGGGMRADRIIDLSDSAFIQLGGTWSQGLLKNVRVEKYYPED